jgi:hypothetical protein
MNNTGKLAEHATAKASITINATFCFSKAMPSHGNRLRKRRKPAVKIVHSQ